MTMKNDDDHNAGLIHQVASPSDETEPRPTCTVTKKFSGVEHHCIHRDGHSGAHTSGSASWQERRCRHCGEEIRLDGSDWIDRETFSVCDTTEALKHEPNGSRSMAALQARIDYLEGTVLPHARKQEHANGFQAGWHSAIDRFCAGDTSDELRALVPDSRKIGSGNQVSDAKRADERAGAQAK